MNVAGISYLAVLIAAVVIELAGAASYMTISRPSIVAVGLTAQMMEENKKKPAPCCPSSTPSWRSW